MGDRISTLESYFSRFASKGLTWKAPLKAVIFLSWHPEEVEYCEMIALANTMQNEQAMCNHVMIPTRQEYERLRQGDKTIRLHQRKDR